MGRHVAGEAPELDALVEETIRRVGAEIDDLRIPRLWGVVLGGGYGRGEGGAFALPDGTLRLSNDLDFYVVAEEGTDGAGLAAIGAALAPLSEKWTARLGIDVDFCYAKTPWRLRHDQERVMVQELVHGYFDVAGAPGTVLFAGVARREPEDFPWMEAARLLMNRGMGLLLAAETKGNLAENGGERSNEFVVRNINKCVLGAGDARLIVQGRYAWRILDRAGALGDPLYSAAVEWKFRPRQDGVCDWEEARRIWLAAADDVCAAPGARSGRNLFNAARWVARRRTLGEPASFGLDPVVRVLRQVRRHIEARRPADASLKKDWEVFN